MILITTSRRPTQKMRVLCKNLNRVLRDSVRTNRGKLSIHGIIEKALDFKTDRVIILERYKGGPGRIVFLQRNLDKFIQAPYQIGLAGVKTQEDIGKKIFIKNSLVITMPLNPDNKIKDLAIFLSNFLKIPYFEDLGNLEFEASIHLTKISTDELKISFTMPPVINEIGPILIAKISPYDV